MSDPVHVGRLNEQARGSVDRALAFEAQLTAVYAGQLRRSARYAAERFRALAPVRMAAVTAAVNPKPPDWAPPDHDELQDEPLNARAAAQATKIHLQAVTAALPPVLAGRLDELGIAYDIASPFADQVLAKVGTKGVNLGLATRDVIVKVIGQAYSEGWTVPQTAAALQSQIDHLSTTTAVMQARCLPAETVIEGAVVWAVSRRWYEGTMVTAICESGREFTATPNHPMLTSRGWVAAGELDEFDYLICGLGQKSAGSSRDEDVAEPPATIAEVFEAAAAIGIRERRRGGKPDFHGDGREGEVDVARPSGELSIGEFSPLYEELVERVFALSGEQHGASFCTSCRRLLSVDEQPCFCGVATGDIGFAQEAFNDYLRDADAVGDRLHALASVVAVGDGGRVEREEVRRTPAALKELVSRSREIATKPRAANGAHDGSTIHSQLLGNLSAGHPTGIELDRIVELREGDFRGHVFNLTTPHGYFLANGAYTGNTDLVGLANGSSLAAVQALGDGAPPVKIWLTAGDELVRPTHADAEGQEVPIDQPFQVGGDLLAYPGDPDGSDAETLNCRCTLLYSDSVTPSEEEALAASAEPSPSSARPTGGVASGTVDTSPESLTAGVTITVDGDEAESTDEAIGEQLTEVPWSGVMTVEGEATRDSGMTRIFPPGVFTWRDTPLPLGLIDQTPHAAAAQAPICGRIDEIWRDGNKIMGAGVLNADEYGARAASIVGNESSNGISVDLGDCVFLVSEDENGEPVLTFTQAMILAATLCPAMALDDARISLTVLMSSDLRLDEAETADDLFDAVTDVLTASAQAERPAREWFETQEPPGLMPLTVTDDGRVFGHLASWDVCHTAFAEACVRPPRSASRYGYFHVGEVETADGGRVAVGKLMVAKVGQSGKHASLNASRAEASRHYDDNTAVGAYIRVIDGRYGPWAAGVVRPGLADEQLAQLRANPPSGDWRRVNGSLELIAALSVPVPGFPVPRADAALVASGELIEVDALIACSGELVESPAVRRALERAGVVDREGPQPTAAMITAKAARAQGRDALVAAALRES